MRRLAPTAVTTCLFLAAAADPPPRAARSVHLSYALPETVKAGITAFYGEVTVEKTVPGSYFEVCGFAGGYFGIQQRTDKKVGIFSVWDAGRSGDDPRKVAEGNRVRTLFVGDGVRATRFGGEGTGGHSDFDCDWTVGQAYRFYLTATADAGSTAYDAWFFDPAAAAWKHVATFAAPDGGRPMRGLYAFIEDFRRDTKSAGEVRRAAYGNAWVRDGAGPWVPLSRATFTASGATWEAKESIDAGATDGRFYLQTGGGTRATRALRSVIELPPTTGKPPLVPGPTTRP